MTLLAREDGRAVIVEDRWLALADDAAAPADRDVIVSLERLRRERDVLLARGGRVGVRVVAHMEPEVLGSELEGVALVVVELPKFTDGRVYTLARLLRERFGYAGELRVTGDVLRDQLFYLARCGFTSFELAPGRDPADALTALEDFSVTYQPAVDHDQPIWRRRAAL